MGATIPGQQLPMGDVPGWGPGRGLALESRFGIKKGNHPGF